MTIGLHDLWGKAKSHPDYVKSEWMELQVQIERLEAQYSKVKFGESAGVEWQNERIAKLEAEIERLKADRKLLLDKFGFNLPPDATIQLVEVHYETKPPAAPFVATDPTQDYDYYDYEDWNQ